MVQGKRNQSEKVNIRKAVMYKRKEEKGRYKRLMGQAIDSKYDDAWELREQEQDAWNKFLFYSRFQEALDKVEK